MGGTLEKKMIFHEKRGDSLHQQATMGISFSAKKHQVNALQKQGGCWKMRKSEARPDEIVERHAQKTLSQQKTQTIQNWGPRETRREPNPISQWGKD